MNNKELEEIRDLSIEINSRLREIERIATKSETILNRFRAILLLFKKRQNKVIYENTLSLIKEYNQAGSGFVEYMDKILDEHEFKIQRE